MTTDQAARAGDAATLLSAATGWRHRRLEIIDNDGEQHALTPADLAIRAASVHASLDSSDAVRVEANVQRVAGWAATSLTDAHERFLDIDLGGTRARESDTDSAGGRRRPGLSMSCPTLSGGERRPYVCPVRPRCGGSAVIETAS